MDRKLKIRKGLWRILTLVRKLKEQRKSKRQ